MTSYKIYVNNIPFSATNQDLWNAFEPLAQRGRILNAYIVYEIDQTNNKRHKKRSRGFGFVEFSSIRDFGRAVSGEYNVYIGDRKLYIAVAND